MAGPKPRDQIRNSTPVRASLNPLPYLRCLATFGGRKRILKGLRPGGPALTAALPAAPLSIHVDWHPDSNGPKNLMVLSEWCHKKADHVGAYLFNKLLAKLDGGPELRAELRWTSEGYDGACDSGVHMYPPHKALLLGKGTVGIRAGAESSTPSQRGRSRPWPNRVRQELSTIPLAFFLARKEEGSPQIPALRQAQDRRRVFAPLQTPLFIGLLG